MLSFCNLVLCLSDGEETISFFWISFSVVIQNYDVDVFKKTTIRGNDALLKCEIPSHVSDLVIVDSWVDSQGTEIRTDHNSASMQQGKLIQIFVFKLVLRLYLHSIYLRL